MYKQEDSLILLTITIQPATLFNSLHDLIRMAFPAYELHEGRTENSDGNIDLTLTAIDRRLAVKGSILMNGRITRDTQEYELYPDDSEPASIKYWARVFVYLLICRHLERNFNPYGILTGVRPLKIVHRLLDEGWSSEYIKRKLEGKYLLSSPKAELLIETAGNNHSALPSRDDARRQLSLYIGIPFCSSRCYYCSFPGAVLKDYERDLDPYISALLLEMNKIGDYISASGWQVQTVYIGGGTPTVLTDNHLQCILEVLYHKYISRATREITMEAGRPDTLSPPRLQMLQQAGVTRVCINPQTMNDETLTRIGRRHSADMVADAVLWARTAGIKDVNMDLIVGLPGEERQHIENSMARVLQLNPENITVHTLAVKRGSSMARIEGKASDPERSAAAVEEMGVCDRMVREAGYQPYYLYRQKYMQAGLENTGYTKPGSACLYNIQMIEERQTILGLGGGSSSKLVSPSDWSLTSLHNPKDPGTYIRMAEHLSVRKVDKLRALN